MSRRLDETDLHDLERAARTGFAHPVDVLRLVREVRELRRAGGSLEKTARLSVEDLREFLGYPEPTPESFPKSDPDPLLVMDDEGPTPLIREGN